MKTMKNLATLVLMSIIATATLTSCTDYYLDADTHYETENQLMDDLSYSEWSLSSIKNENGEYLDPNLYGYFDFFVRFEYNNYTSKVSKLGHFNHTKNAWEPTRDYPLTGNLYIKDNIIICYDNNMQEVIRMEVRNLFEDSMEAILTIPFLNESYRIILNKKVY